MANLLAPPMGHLYVGRPGRGLVVSGAYALLGAALMLLALRAGSVLSLALLLAALGAAYAAVAVDAFLLARHAGPGYELRSCNRWYVYLVALVVVSVATNRYGALIRREVVEAFTIPSGAMTPTLLVGDHILTNKRAYRAGDPERGDVAVLEDPTDSTKLFVKRVVGLPGDTIELRRAVVWLNGAPLDEPYALRGDGTTPADYPPLTIPRGYYFVLGDKRDASNDSRAWGPVAREKFRGRAQLVYWSWDDGVRWERVGMPIRSSGSARASRASAGS